MSSQINSFFIFGAPRSGTTFMSRLFKIAKNAKVYSEQSPKLGYESRQKHLGNFKSYENSKGFIKVQKQDSIDIVNELGYIYGDKNINFLPFLKEMHEVWEKSRFVFIYRDGRDVISSMYNWSLAGGNIFGMEEDLGTGMGTQYPIHDLWDYSRIRPKEGELYHEQWIKLDLFQKLCVYWQYYNSYAISIIEQLGKERFFFVNSTTFSEKDYKKLFDFLYIEGFDEKECKLLIDKKVNTSSLNDKQKFPSWKDWNDEQKEFYKKVAKETHIKLLGELVW